MSKNILKNIFLAKHSFNKKQKNKSEEIGWVLIEITPECKVYIYKYCIEEFSEIIKKIYPEAVLFNSQNKLFAEAIREANILVGWRFPEELLLKAENLKWIQLISVGFDVTRGGLIIPKYITNNDVVITNAKGLYSDVVAEYVLWAILTMSRKMHLILRAQTQRRWIQHIGEDTGEKIVGILGLGMVGTIVAEKVKAIGMKVFAIKRHYTSEHNIPNIDSLYPVTKLTEFLNNVDFLIICLPLTSETKWLIGKNEFKQMKNNVSVIDVSRGGIVKHKDLIWAIKNKIIAGAVLDVFENEPLPKDSELWDLNNVVVTPHISGITTEYCHKVGSFFCDNLRRFLKNEPLINITDLQKGY